MVLLTELRLRAARARIADAVAVSAATAELGSVTLQPHQQRALERATHMISCFGGCLLAEEVGRGKTYVALAVAKHWQRPLIIVPASLRSTWQRAMDRAGVSAVLMTHEALSRGSRPSFAPDGVIVDESHRFRSPDARRHAVLAAITAYVPVLLLSATPLQNGARDLAAQLALFLGSSAFRSSDAALAKFVVRSAEHGDVAALPRVAPPVWLQTGHDDGAVLRAILTLPPPARAFDAGDAGALRTIALVRAWASSRAALHAAVRRRMRDVTALEQCATTGLTPTRRDLRAWQGVGGDVQLALAPLLVSRADGAGTSALLQAVSTERTGLDRLRDALRASTDPDLARVDALRRLRDEHPGARILAFSEFASTVRAYYALMRADAGVGMLTANAARIASGRLPRDALLERFAPAAQGARDPAFRERVTLLLSTDLLSEGINLQDASVVVHLDLPWNPARLAQRLGRVRRPGGAAVVHSYLMSPPARTELLLRADARLRVKLARAERTIGPTLDVMPTLPALVNSTIDIGGGAARNDVAGANAERLGAITERMASWRRARSHRVARHSGGPLVAGVACNEDGWLAALDDGRLLARIGSAAANVDAAVVHAVELSCGPARPIMDEERVGALREVAEWLEREALAADCGVHEDASPIDAAIERRIAGAMARAPRHERVRLLGLATRLRGLLGRARPLGAERELAALMSAHAEDARHDVAWLEQSITVSERASARQAPPGRPRVVALVLFTSGRRV